MADPKALSILLSGVQTWNDWRRLQIEGADPSGTLSYTSRHLSSKPDVGVVDFRGADLANRDLRGARLEHCSLEGANLAGSNLRNANLCWTCLGEADLRGANLDRASLNETYASFAKFEGASLVDSTVSNAILHIASFVGCEMTRANLSDSDLRDADFRSVNLSESNLHLAKFISTKLEGAVFNGAQMGRTILSGVDLRNVSGLETVSHGGPSTIGSDTLYLSRGNVPEVFLRGIGMEESLISYLPSLTASSAIDFYSCFISYSHEQKLFARRLHDQLQMRGIRCWLDEHQLLPGDDIYDEVDRGIRLWDKVLLCCSRSALSSWWVSDEIDKALEKEIRLQKERGSKILAIVPIDLDGFLLNGWQDGRAATLRKRVAADFVGWETDNGKFEASFEKVARALRTDEEFHALRQCPSFEL
jgi:uncharacterized protein YjbI with pentapeptide repeats